VRAGGLQGKEDSQVNAICDEIDASERHCWRTGL
jgi:hypothetical protein